MGYVENFDLFTDEANDLHKKVGVAIDQAARDVINEDPGTTNHAERIIWAQWIRAAPDRVVGEAHRAILRVLDNSTVAAAGNAANDADVQTAVNGLINTLAQGGYR